MYGTQEFTEWYEFWQQRQNRQKESKTSVQELMKRSNPAVIPRNHRVEEALEAAVEKEDNSVMDKLLNVLSHPYDHTRGQDEYTAPAPPSAQPYRTFCGT